MIWLCMYFIPLYIFYIILIYIKKIRGGMDRDKKDKFENNIINYSLNKNNIFIISNEKKLKKYKDIIDFEETNNVYKFFNKINLNNDIHIIIITEGGDCDCADTIAYNLSQLKDNGFKYKINCYIPAHAFSSGTMIALASDNIYMDWYSNVSPIDTQLTYEIDDNETF